MWVKAKVKKGWYDAGKIFFILGESVRVNVMDWTPIVYDGEDDPTWIKSSAVEILPATPLQNQDLLSQEPKELKQ